MVYEATHTLTPNPPHWLVHMVLLHRWQGGAGSSRGPRRASTCAADTP